MQIFTYFLATLRRVTFPVRSRSTLNSILIARSNWIGRFAFRRMRMDHTSATDRGEKNRGFQRFKETRRIAEDPPSHDRSTIRARVNIRVQRLPMNRDFSDFHEAEVDRSSTAARYIMESYQLPRLSPSPKRPFAGSRATYSFPDFAARAFLIVCVRPLTRSNTVEPRA